jgi:hypothetical protein|tara:strand:+ start:276 stop:734 length:459 start_codon:yes stop_codon:yes gene_type:complete
MSRLYNTFKNIFIGGAQKTTGTGAINSVNIAKNLAKKKNIKDDLVKARDKQLANVRDEAKVEIKSKNPLSKFTKKIENIVDRKAKGGRVGLKRGTGLGGKSNVDKIKKTFGPKSLGMQSVIYGLDKNKNVTAADPKAKFIAAANKKKKKKVI